MLAKNIFTGIAITQFQKVYSNPSKKVRYTRVTHPKILYVNTKKPSFIITINTFRTCSYFIDIQINKEINIEIGIPAPQKV